MAPSRLLEVKVNFESEIVGDRRGLTPNGRKIYTLGDIYPQADLVTYPSTIEGFGNAFLYELARRYYSFTMLERRLNVLLSDCFGELP